MAQQTSTGLATSADVAEAAAVARAHGRIGVDTEFMSEGRYRPLLCLIQVAVDGDGVLLIDAFAGVDLSPLAAVVADAGVEVIVHAGRQDVAILRRVLGVEIDTLFDTQVAAGFAGASAQAGYGNLLGAVLGRRVDKTASFTRWDARPLTGEQLHYAAEDVEHLLELADELQRQLRASGRLEWAREECRRLETATDERDPLAVWQRLPRIGQLDPRSRAVARELAAWREQTASREDRPVGSVVADPPLVELAKRQPRDVGGLEQTRGLHQSTVRKRGQEILAAIGRGRKAPPIPREPVRYRSDPADAPMISLAEALLRARALQAGLAYELIASRSELELIVAAVRRGEPEPDVRTLTGWRRELVGVDLRDLLSGQRAVAVGADHRLVLTPAPPPASATSPATDRTEFCPSPAQSFADA